TRGGRRLEAVHAVTGTVAGVRPVAGTAVQRPDAGRRRRLETVRRACARGPRAALRHVALTRRGAARRGRRLEAVHAVAGTVAGVRPVTGTAVRGPDAGRRRRLEAVRRARARRPRAALRHVALTRRGTARRGRRLE